MSINANFLKYAKTNYAPNTCASYTRYINNLLTHSGKEDADITEEDVNDWLGWMANTGHIGSTRSLALNAVRTYYDYLESHDYVESNPCRLVKKPRVVNKPKYYMDAEMIHNMVLHAKSYRDKAIILLYGSAGVRVSELTGLTITDYLEMKRCHGNQIEITSKRDKRRFVYFSPEVQEAIDKYLPIRNKGKVKCDRLFLTNQGNEMARSNLNTALKNIAKEAGIPFYNEMSNHQLRSACATIYLEDGMTLPELQSLLGHENVSTTLRYTKTNTAKVENAVMGKRFM